MGRDPIDRVSFVFETSMLGVESFLFTVDAFGFYIETEILSIAKL